MAQLTVTVHDLSDQPAEDVEIVARLTDLNGRPIVAYTLVGDLLIEPVRAITDATGTAVLDLVPQDNVARDNTYYTIHIGRTPGGVSTDTLILKTDQGQTLESAEVITPAALGPSAGLANLRDVDLTGILNGQILRWDGSKLVPYTLPSGGAGSDQLPYRFVNSSGAVALSDSVLKVDATGGPITLTLPSAVGIGGKAFTIKCVAGTVVVATFGSQKIDVSNSWTIETLESFTFMSDNTNWMVT